MPRPCATTHRAVTVAASEPSIYALESKRPSSLRVPECRQSRCTVTLSLSLTLSRGIDRLGSHRGPRPSLVVGACDQNIECHRAAVSGYLTRTRTREDPKLSRGRFERQELAQLAACVSDRRRLHLVRENSGKVRNADVRALTWNLEVAGLVLELPTNLSWLRCLRPRR